MRTVAAFSESRRAPHDDADTQLLSRGHAGNETATGICVIKHVSQRYVMQPKTRPDDYNRNDHQEKRNGKAENMSAPLHARLLYVSVP
jgi:hypothetical protein